MDASSHKIWTHCSNVAQRRTQRPDIRFPFHHLHSDGFWTALDENGKPSPDDKLTRLVSMPSDFVAFANDPASRNKARRILIAKYFEGEERVALYSLVGIPVPEDEQQARDASEADQPVLVVKTVSMTFPQPDADGVVDSDDPDLSGVRHAVLAVATAKRAKQKLVLVRNSWGDTWGLTGYAWLSERYLAPRIMAAFTVS